MPVTCHHCFELCRHALSSKHLAGKHHPPPLRLPAYPLPSPPRPYYACRVLCHGKWTPQCMPDFRSNRLYIRPPAMARFSLQEWIMHAGYLFCHHAGLFAWCVPWSICFVSISEFEYPRCLLIVKWTDPLFLNEASTNVTNHVKKFFVLNFLIILYRINFLISHFLLNIR